MQRQQITISMPEVATYKYKDTAREIEDLVKQLNSFTNRLQDKVNNMLKGQEIQFVNSYKDHMRKVQSCLKEYQLEIQENHKKIEFYENEGVHSNLLKKINFLENNQKQLLTKISKKDRVLLVLKGEISTQQRQIASLQQKIRQLLLNQQIPTSMIQQGQKHPQPTFATQINSVQKRTLNSDNSVDYLSKAKQQFLTISPISDRPDYSLSLQGQQLDRYKRQLVNLKKKNRQLSSVNSKILDKATQIEDFFLKTVNDLKKKILSRKQFTSCSYEDFKRQDKIQLLIKVLSNDEILQHLYTKIFKKSSTIDPQISKLDQRMPSSALTERVISRLPAIISFKR